MRVCAPVLRAPELAPGLSAVQGTSQGEGYARIRGPPWAKGREKVGPRPFSRGDEESVEGVDETVSSLGEVPSLGFGDPNCHGFSAVQRFSLGM